MREYSPKRRTALVLAGSGTSGAYHAGVLRALDESGVKIDLVVGSGVGTVAAAFAAAAGGRAALRRGRLLGRAWAGTRSTACARRCAPRSCSSPARSASSCCRWCWRSSAASCSRPSPLADLALPGLTARMTSACSSLPAAAARAVPGRPVAAHLRPVRAGLPGHLLRLLRARPPPHRGELRVAARPGGGRGAAGPAASGRSRAAPPSRPARPPRRSWAGATSRCSPRTWASPASAS